MSDYVSDSENPMAALFQEKGIRILGTAEDPLFCAPDTAKYIGDAHSDRVFRESTPEEYIRWELARDARGRLQKTRFLTESGLYRYLLRSGRPRAEEFQSYVYNLLKTERKRIIDSVQLELRIAQTKYEECEKKVEEYKQKNEKLTKSE